MKLTDIINRPFPDNEGYRLNDIQKVERKNNTYILLLTFQKIENARNDYESSNFKSLRDFNSGKTILRIGNIAYSRLFVIGSVWWNEGKPLAIPPIYLGRYSFDSKIIGERNLVLSDTSYFQDDHSIGMKYIYQGENQTRYANMLCFELSTPLFHHKKKEDVFPLYSHIPPWEKPTDTNFIAFHSYEVYRYFFTSYGITDLNARMLFPQFNPNSPTENLLFDPMESVEKDGKHFVHLRKSYDLEDTSVLGNIAYYNAFKAIIRKMQNYLNKLNSFDFDSIENLPVSRFKQMQVSAVRVRRKSDGVEGLYVVQIHSCSGYIGHDYTPVVPIIDTTAPKRPGTSGGGRGTRGPKEGVGPKVNHDTTTGMGTDTIDLDLFGLEQLLTPNQDIVLDETLHKLVHEDGSFSLFPSDPNGEPILPPGPHPDDKGLRPKNNINVERTNYFEFFPEIVELICAKIKSLQLSVSHSYLGDDLLYHPNARIIDATKIKTITLTEEDPKWELYVAEIRVSGPDAAARYYYLFEKYSETYTSSRTWLFSQLNFAPFSKENDLISSIKEFLLEQRNSDLLRKEPNNKFNHLQSKEAGKKENGDKDYVSVEKDEALNKHIQKICSRILKVYGLKYLQ